MHVLLEWILACTNVRVANSYIYILQKNYVRNNVRTLMN